MLSRRFVLAASVALTANVPIGAAHASEAEARRLVDRVTQELITLVRSPGDRSSKESAFRRMMEQNSDLRQIAGFTAGRYARSMNPQQRDRFVDVFADFITRTYVARFDEYQGETISISNVTDNGNRGFLVESQVERGGQQPLAVSWLVSDRSGEMKVIDIFVEGISMAQSQRSEFTSMIAERNGDIDRFIEALQQRGRS